MAIIMTRPFDVFKGYIFQSVTKADFPCQKGSLLMDTISCVSLFLERQTNVLFIGVFNALIHEQFLYRSQSITAKTGGCAG